MKLTSLLSLMLCLDTIKTLPLPEGWEKNPEPVTTLEWGSPLTGGVPAWIDIKAGGSSFVTLYSENLSFDSGWLIIHHGDTEPKWSPEAVLIETKNKPVVTKIGDRWVIRFKP